MKNTKKSIGWALGAALAFNTLPASAGVFADLDSYVSMNGKSIEQALYLSYSIKVNERYTIVPETLNSITYRSDGANKTSVGHVFNRITVTNKDLMRNLGEWKSDLKFRYVLPTDKGLQEQGSFGGLSFLMPFKRTMGDFEFALTPRLDLNMQRNGYAIRTTPKRLASGKPEGNHILTLAFDPTFSYKLTDKLVLGGEILFLEYVYLLDGVTGTDGTATRTAHRLAQMYELSYTVVDGTDLGVYVDHDNRWGRQGEEFKFWSGAANVGLSVAHKF